MSEPFKSPLPHFTMGKARLSDDQKRAVALLWWHGGQFATREIKRGAYQFVRDCYPEAQNIRLWAVGDDRLEATFDVVNPKQNKKADWTWRYE